MMIGSGPIFRLFTMILAAFGSVQASFGVQQRDRGVIRFKIATTGFCKADESHRVPRAVFTSANSRPKISSAEPDCRHRCLRAAYKAIKRQFFHGGRHRPHIGFAFGRHAPWRGFGVAIRKSFELSTLPC